MNSTRIHRLRTTFVSLVAALSLSPAFVAHAQAAPPAPARSAAAPAKAVKAPAVEGVLNINTATLDELTRLPSVGPSRAQAILELRTKIGGFKKLDDLMRVKGIGRKTFRDLEPLLRLDGKTTLVKVAHARGAAAH